MANVAESIPKLKLNNGQQIPAFGLGTWKSKPGEVTQAVKDAIDIGYRHIDGARIYQNEAEIGVGLKAKFDEGVVKREDMYIVSKLWNTCHRPDLVIPAVKQSLKDLGVEYLDLYLIHWPIAYKEDCELFPKDENGKFLYSDVDYVDTWKALEEAVNIGLIKSIGLSNFNSEQIERILNICTIKPAVNQVEIHPYLNQKKLMEFCRSKGMVVTGYSPLGSADRPWAKPEDSKLLDDPKLCELGRKYGKSSAQIVLRWAIQRNVVTIPKTVTKARLLENIAIFDFTLSDEDVEYINTFDCNGRNCHVAWVNDHKYFPFGIEF